MLLGLIFICTVTPWILAEDNGHTTTETTTHVDDTRREDTPHKLLSLSEDRIENVSQFLVETDNDNTGKNINDTNTNKNVRRHDQNLSKETELEGEGLCDNAEFLVKILTSIIPLLKKEVPEHVRTTYVLKIFRDLLKSSPEAAQDHEVMSKINDLLQTLEKYHLDGLADNKNALRQSVGVPELQGVNSKIVFKYEIPHFQNEDCTAELLTIIKMVQESILRLVNNPLCKSKIITTKLPLVTNFDAYLENPELYTNWPSPNTNFPNEDSLIIEEKVLPYVPQNTFPYYKETETNSGYPYNSLPSQDTRPSNSFTPEKSFDALSIVPNLHNSPTDSPSLYDSSPIFSHMINGDIDKPRYPLDINEMDNEYHGLHKNTPQPLFNIYPSSDGPSPFDRELDFKPVPLHVNFGQEQPTDTLELEEYIPIETGRPSQNIVPIPSPKYIPLDFYGPDNSAYTPIVQNSYLDSDVHRSSTSSTLEVNGIPDTDDVESVLPFEITGGGSGVIHIGPFKKHSKPSSDLKFDSFSKVDIHSPSTSHLPFFVSEDGSVETEINQNLPYSNFEFDLPSKRPSHHSKILDGVNVIDQNQPNTVFHFESFSTSSSPSPVEVIGDNGSAEIPIGLSQSNPAFNFDFPIKPQLSTPFQVTESAESAYVPIVQTLNPLDFYITGPGNKRPADVPNKYDSLANSAPLLNGEPDSSSENPLNNREPSPYKPDGAQLPFDFFIPTPKPYSPLEVTGDGSGEILIGSSPQSTDSNFMSFHLPNLLTKGNIDSSQEIILTDEKDFDVRDSPSSMMTNDLNFKEILPTMQDTNIYSNELEINSLYPITSGNEHPDTITNKYYLTSEDSLETNRLPSNNKKIIISEPDTPDLQIVNQYVVADENNLPYEKILQSEMLPDDSDISKSILWSNESPNPMLNNYSPEQAYSLIPDKKILIIIKDDVDIMEQKIPKKYLSAAIRKHIKKIKELLTLEQLTVEEYVSIINQYQSLIELIKNLDISNKILKELLLSLTNGGKLESQTGKSNVIELTYLIKRPTPLIYQPYYYIKYQLPYVSFLTRMERILAKKPHLSKNPAKLYKELLHISKVAETSPDLEGYDKNDIQKITFNDGTLAGAKMIEGKTLSMYDTLNALKTINTDYTVEDIYQIIKNLDAQLKNSPGNGLVMEYDSKPAINYFKNTDQILVKLKKQPKVTEKITKISTKEFISDQVKVLEEINNLRSNMSAHQIDEKKINDSVPFVARSKDTYRLSQLNGLVGPIKINPSVGYNLIDNKIKTDEVYHHKSSKKKDDVAYDYLPMYSDFSKETFFNYSGKKSDFTDEPYDIIQKNDVSINWNKFNSKPIQHDKLPSSSIESKLLDATINAYGKEVNSHMSKQNDFQSNHNFLFEPSKTSTNYFADDSNIIHYKWKPPVKDDVYSKLLDATIKAHNYIQENDPTSQQFSFDSEPSASFNYIVGKPETVESQLVQHSKTYVNDIPFKHSKTYVVNNPSNQVNQFQTYNNDKRNDFDSEPSASFNYIVGKPETVQSQLVQHSKTYVNDIPLKHSKTYVVNNPFNQVNQFQTYDNDKRNDFDSEPSASFNYIVGKPETVESQLVQHSKTYVNDIPFKHSKTYVVNNPSNQVNQFQTYNNDKRNDFVKQFKPYPNNPYLNFDNYNLAKNSRNIVLPNQKVYKKNFLNPYYRHYVNHRMPLSYKKIRMPWSRDILG